MLYELLLDDRADPQLVHLAGLACLGLGRIEEALAHLERATTQAPDRADFRSAYANALIDTGALERFRQLLEITRDAGLARRGVLKTAASVGAESLRDCVARLVDAAPDDGAMAGVLGYAHLLNRDPVSARPFYAAATRLLPGDSETRRMAGLVAAALGDAETAKMHFAPDHYDAACAGDLQRLMEFMLAVLPDGMTLPMMRGVWEVLPDNPRIRNFCIFHVMGLKAEAEALVMLETMAAGAGLPPPPTESPAVRRRLERIALAYFTYAAARDADDYIVFLLLAVMHAKREDFDAALHAARRAVDLRPDDAEAVLVLARYRARTDLPGAIATLRDADPRVASVPEVLNLLGNLRLRVGDMAGAAEAYDEARARLGAYDGEKLEWQLLTSNYRHDLDPATVAAMHRAWGEALEARLRPRRRPARYPRTTGPLRVGYVSGDFGTTSPAYFLLPLLQNHDPARVRFYLYATQEKEDEATPIFRRLAQQTWRDVHALEDDAMCDAIEEDEIDILVDLCGHTTGARLPVFAIKPAPVQVTWLGYPNTTGLRTIDYRFTDALADPPGMTEALHTETLWRLPHFLCYQPMPVTPEVADAPCLQSGHATFGCFNNTNKVTPDVVEAWAEILRRSPDARLVLKTIELGDPGTREAFVRRFIEAGVDPARIECLPAVKSKFDHLRVYGRIDLALDPFPYNGTTTTCEAMWMGVPTLTLAGSVHATRVGVSLLTAVGLPELVASDIADYAEKATTLAHDLPRLAGLRQGLRERLQVSPLMDAKAFASSMENAYAAMAKTQKG